MRTASAFGFLDKLPKEQLATLWNRLHSNDLPVVNRQQRELVLMEQSRPYAAKKRTRQGKSGE